MEVSITPATERMRSSVGLQKFGFCGSHPMVQESRLLIGAPVRLRWAEDLRDGLRPGTPIEEIASFLCGNVDEVREKIKPLPSKQKRGRQREPARSKAPGVAKLQRPGKFVCFSSSGPRDGRQSRWPASARGFFGPTVPSPRRRIGCSTQ
jgi:hypothetical protein